MEQTPTDYSYCSWSALTGAAFSDGQTVAERYHDAPTISPIPCYWIDGPRGRWWWWADDIQSAIRAEADARKLRERGISLPTAGGRDPRPTRVELANRTSASTDTSRLMSQTTTIQQAEHEVQEQQRRRGLARNHEAVGLWKNQAVAREKYEAAEHRALAHGMHELDKWERAILALGNYMGWTGKPWRVVAINRQDELTRESFLVFATDAERAKRNFLNRWTFVDERTDRGMEPRAFHSPDRADYILSVEPFEL